MRRRHPNGTGSGSALQQQGKSRHQQRRGLGVRHLLRLLVLLAAQQGGAMVDGGILGRSILQPGAAAGFLLAPQAAQAQQSCPELSAPTITVTTGDGQLTVNWSALTTGQSVVEDWEIQYRKGSDGWQYRTITNTAARSYTITGLENGAVYRVKLYADSTCGDSSEDSNTVTATPAASPGVTISAETLTVDAGASKTYTVVLDSDPGAQVVVTPTSTPVAKATVSGALTFTTATNHWSTAQTVTVTGVAAGTATIDHTITGYTGVQNSDIEDVDVTVNAAPAVAAPVLTTATSTTSGEINLTWTHAGSSGRDFFPASLPQAAQFSHWEVSHRLKGATSWMDWGSSTLSSGTSLRTVAASLANAYPDGAVVEVRVNAVATLTSGSNSYPIAGPWSNTRTVTYKNDNLDALTFSGSSVTVAVNDTATYTVKLTKAYGGVVSVTSDDTDKATVSPSTLTFTTATYNTAQTVTVTGVATGGSPGIDHAFRLTGATADAIPDAGSVGVTVNAAPVTIKPPTGLTIVPGPDRLYLSWTAPTDANRTGWRVRYRLFGGNWPANWTAISGAATTSYTITGLSRGYTYQVELAATGASSAASTAATEEKATTAGIHYDIGGSSLAVTEGSSNTYTVRLLSRGTASVTLTPSSANTDLSFSPTALTFTTADWDTNQTVTVTAAADEDTDNEPATISYTVSGGNYPAVTTTHPVNIFDTTPTLQLSTDPAAVTEGTAISLTVTSDRTLIGPLPVSLTLAARSSSGFTAADIPGTLGPNTFNADFGSSPGGTTGTVSIPTSADTDASEGAENYQITLNDAAGYAVGTDVTANGVLNDAAAAISLSVADASAAEGDGAMSFTVTASSAPSTAVTFKYTVTAESGDTATAGTDFTAVMAAAKGSGTIAANAQTTTITVTVVDDNTDENDETFTVTLSEPSGATISDAVATGTITDDDGADPGVTISEDSLTVDAGDSATYTVVLDSDPGAQVVVTPTSTPVAKATVSGALTFTTATNNWSTAQTVTVTGVAAGTATIDHTITGYSGVTASDIEDVEVTVEATASKPAAPTNFRAAAGNAQVTLTWDDPDNDDITGYEVRYGKKNVRRRAEWAAISGSDADTTTHTVSSLQNGSEYSFKVRAVNGDATDWVDATPVAPVTIQPPTGLTIVAGPDRLYLSWTAPTDANRTGWRVRYRRREGVNWGEWSSWTAITGAATTSYDLTGLDINYTHEVALAATGASNAASTAVTAQGITDAGVLEEESRELGVNEGGTASYKVKINSRPTGDVTLTPSSANTDLSFSPTALTFTTADWDTYQTLTVRAASDEDTNEETTRINYATSGGGYEFPSQEGRKVRITDTTPTLQLSTDPSAVSEGTAISLTVTSDRALTGTLPVRLTLAARDSSTFTAADITGTLGPRNFNAVFGDTARTTGTVSIPTSTDADATEGAEAYRITLSDAAGYAVGTDVEAEGVLNDGTAATVSVPATVTVAEGVSSAKAVVTITTPRAFGASTTFNVSYGSTSSTADTDARGRGNPTRSNNGDYDNNDVTSVTFSAIEKTKAIEIPIRNDKLDEGDETFTVTIAAAAALPAGFSLGNATTTVTITDDDNAPVLAAIEDVDLKQGQAVDITASATDADGDSITYTWSRKSGEDSPAIPGGAALNAARLNFTPPATGTYTMTVTASDGNGNAATEEVRITVTDANVVRAPQNVTVAEGAGNAVVRIRTAEAFGQAVTFNVSYGSTSVTTDNDATGAATPASGDYDNNAVTTVAFGASDTTKDIAIPITDDDLDEENETFTVTIAPAAALPSGFQLARATTVVTITDDDTTPVLAAIENVTLKQGQAVDITASATDADGDSITYTWTRKDGESTPAIPGGTGLAAARLKFTPPGTGTYTMTVTASDGTNEATEEVVITVTNANVVQVPERVEVAEGDGNAVVRITTTEAFGQAVTFNVSYGSTSSTSDTDATGAATPASGDYDNDAVTSVSFGASDTSKEIRIPITDDQTVEGEETFTVTIAPAAALPGGFQLARATTVVTITDNDQSTGSGGSGSGGSGGGSGGSTPSSVPAAPTGVGESPASVGNGQVTLTWANPGDSTISKWQVQWREIGSPTGARLGLEAASYRPGGQPAQQAQEGGYGDWTDIPDSNASTTSHTVTGLTNGKTYGFRIRAVNTAGRPGLPSAEVRVTLRQPPSQPTGVTATPGDGQVSLAWTGPTDATISKWQVQQKQGSGSYGAWMDVPNSTASTRSHTVTGLTNGATYGFRIRAVNAAGPGDPSDEVTATPVHPDMVQADKARTQALAATSRTLLGMATDVLGDRTGGDTPMALAAAGDSLGNQAMGVVENLLGIGGSELPTSLTLEEVEDRLWSQSFQLSPPSAEEGSTQQQSWAFWGAGELRSYRSEEEEGISSSGNLKTAWLGVDYPFTHRGLAGLALSFSSGQSDYSYRKTDGANDGGRMDTRLTTFYPYGSFQVSQQLRLWAMAGIGWGSQHHQQTGDDAKAEGDLRLQMGVVGFERQLDSIGAVNLSLAGDAGLVKSTTAWQSGSGLEDLSVTLHRIRMGVDGSFPLAEHTTGYVNLKGRIDGGDLPMNAAELVAGVQYSQARFSGFLQGRQVYAFDGSYAESGLTAQLRLTSNSDGTGLAWTLQPSYGAGNGDVALAAGPSLWTDEQLERLTGAGAAQQEGQHLEWSSRVGYGIRLESSDLLLTPFTEVRLWEGTSHRIGLGLTVEAASWNLEFSGSTEHITNSSPTGNLQLNFSKRL